MTGDLLLAGTSPLLSTLEGLHFDLNSAQGTIGGISERIDRLKIIIGSLVELPGASVVAAGKTKTAVEQGSDEEAGGRAPAIRSANDRGLTVEFQFDRQQPGFGHEDVISISPPPGALTNGSTVVVTINLEG